MVKRLHSLLLLKNLLPKIPSRVYLGSTGRTNFFLLGRALILLPNNHKEEAAVKSNTLAILWKGVGSSLTSAMLPELTQESCCNVNLYQ